ncbi:tRNA uridine-5-carboxymethylaminomethyl(34) synthesis GTPase MnmE [Rhizobium sp. CNPSo 4039]|uniref:tRNA uridine-5-carboxymethylaminomethyl(34) synthesis GTPase MnmE n=1 Tax=Rhizobium sp. CNPSo 4039 TaxID=3021409 RepID=UPI00254FF01D|nr:tRNA uridine-5-carboxymethylaminomethyl(34) synthesis GTPase MnmE [Rhizobium sp. CNPSo 4039]MDK4713737.1 tRNA uridine-5-carboxymethylaminomethyl(34) synthesis GTPase MnmE [Rhizobium sp. CNPSo 4039]
MLTMNETIYALSSGGLPAGVAVIRISGNLALRVAESLAGPLPQPRQAVLRTIRTRNNLMIDRGLVLVFPGPASFTGEDCVEIHVHGGKAVVNVLLEELSTFENCRMAEHGEFSRRALENGKMDLVEVEGLADLIGAETEMQRRLALEHAAGGLSDLYNGWADRLTRARALIEAELDFADEDDVPGSVSDMVWADMKRLRLEISDHLAGADLGEIIRDGLKVVIAGAPNVGKSSLMNALAKREVAIVTDIAGTTRDVLHIDLNIEGYAVRLYDTAGLRDTDEVVEREGIRRALRTVADADLVLSLAEIGGEAQRSFPGFAGKVLTVGTKADIHAEKTNQYDLLISSSTGSGLAELHELLRQDLQIRSGALSLALPSRLRHRTLLAESLDAVEAALSSEDHGLDIRAEYLRRAATSLGRITGRVDVEDLLDVIFSEFCIGK